MGTLPAISPTTPHLTERPSRHLLQRVLQRGCRGSRPHGIREHVGVEGGGRFGADANGDEARVWRPIALLNNTRVPAIRTLHLDRVAGAEHCLQMRGIG